MERKTDLAERVDEEEDEDADDTVGEYERSWSSGNERGTGTEEELGGGRENGQFVRSTEGWQRRRTPVPIVPAIEIIL